MKNNHLENDHNKLIEQYDNQYNDLCKEIKVHSSARERFVKKVEELRQQLAEKEKEIDEVRSNHANLVADIAYKAVNVYTAENKETGVPTFYKIHYSQLLEIEDMNNLRNYAQDKISFAIAELEKVKEKIQEDRESLINCNNTSEVLMADGFLCDCKNFIDNQIAELKEKDNG